MTPLIAIPALATIRSGTSIVLIIELIDSLRPKS